MATPEAQTQPSPIRKVIIYIILVGVGYLGVDYFINSSVVSDELKKFEIVEKTEDKRAICSQMDYVIAAYLHVKDDTNYLKWKEKKKNECSY